MERGPTVYSKAYIAYVVLLLAVTNAVNYMDRMALPILLPSIKHDLTLTDTQLGLLTGFAFALFYAGFGIPIARWADRGDRRFILTTAIVAWSAFTAACGGVRSFYQLLSARIGVGVGEAGCIPTSHSLISDFVPPRERPVALAVHTAGATVGALVGLALGGWLVQTAGWRSAFVLLALPGIVLAPIVALTVTEPLRGHSEHRQRVQVRINVVTALRYLWRRTTYVHVVFVFGGANFVAFGLNQWLPSYYVRNFNVSPGRIGVLFGLAYGVGAGLGTLVGGVVIRRLITRDKRYALWLAAACYLCGAPLAVAMLSAGNLYEAILANFAFTLIVSLPNGGLFSMIQNSTPPSLRATASAVTMLCASLMGLGAGPFMVGLLSDQLKAKYGAHSLRLALICCSIVMLWPALQCIAGARSMAIDQRREETWECDQPVTPSA